MTTELKLPGIISRMVESDRINTHILSYGPPACSDVVFIHGNCASAGIWDQILLAMPHGFHGVAPDLRGYGSTEPLPVDATLGLNDMVDDLRSLIKAMGISPIHLVGHGMGGAVAMKYAVAHSSSICSITLVDTVSPYGFCGSKDVEGTPVYEDGAPAGTAAANPEFVRLLREKDAGVEDPMAPLNVVRRFFVKPPFVYDREEALMESVFSTRVGDDWYPGNSVPSKYWPGSAPGEKGVYNALSRKYFDASALVDIDPKPPILWIRGADDLIVSDNSHWDIAALGAMGCVPDWPGYEECPPQPMLQQIRAVLDQYALKGGQYEEVVIEDAAHSPFLEKPEAFNALFHAFLLANDC